MNVQETVLHTLQNSGVMNGGETLVVGFSGGADSITLLHVLCALRDSLALSQIVAVHVNHRLRGEESERDCRFAQNICRQWHVPCDVYSYDVAALAKQSGKGVEEIGREVRYAALQETASRYEHAYIATAHTLTDNAETLLLHMCRGCGLNGLSGIPLVRGNIIRPLLECDRAQIEAYCQQHHLPFVSDSTNTDTAYARNRVRLKVLSELREINPAVERTFSRFMGQMNEVGEFVNGEVSRLWDAIVTDSADTYQRNSLLLEHPFLQTEVLRRLLTTADIPADSHHIERMRECLQKGGTVSLPKNYRFSVSKQTMNLAKISTETVRDTLLENGKIVSFFSKTYRFLVVSRKEYEQKLNFSNLRFENAFDYDMISGVAVLRSRLDGDAYRPVGRKCTKTLKKLFNESAILPEKRAQIPVIADEKGVVAVCGFGCDERVKISETTERVALLIGE